MKEYYYKINEDIEKAEELYRKTELLKEKGLPFPKKIPQVRLQPKLIQEIICHELAAIAEDDKDRYVDCKVLEHAIERYIDDNVRVRLQQHFIDVKYRISEVVESINKHLQNVDKNIEVKMLSKSVALYKGYQDIHDDWLMGVLIGNRQSLDSKAFLNVDAVCNFDLHAVIRNTYNYRENTIDNILATRFAKWKPEEKEAYKKKRMPYGKILFLEDGVQKTSADQTEKTEKWRNWIVKLLIAIICQKPVKVSYKPDHLPVADDLEFHPHVIRRVERKYFCYGLSRSIKYHGPEDFTLVNLMIGRIENISQLDGDEKDSPYLSAMNNDYDYEKMFSERLTFNAPHYNKEFEKPETVVIKVRRMIPTTTNPRYPYNRLLKEPLHHSQGTAEAYGLQDKYPLTDDYGYICFSVKDANYIKRQLLVYGSDIEVMEPLSLRNIMATEIRMMAEAYKNVNIGPKA